MKISAIISMLNKIIASIMITSQKMKNLNLHGNDDHHDYGINIIFVMMMMMMMMTMMMMMMTMMMMIMIRRSRRIVMIIIVIITTMIIAKQ